MWSKEDILTPEWIEDIIQSHAGAGADAVDKFSQILHEDDWWLVARDIVKVLKEDYFAELNETEDIKGDI